MKLFMTLITTLLLATSVYAEDCKEGSKTCTKEECIKLGADYGIMPAGSADAGKCIKIASQQKSSTECPAIIQANGAKATDSGTTTEPAKGGKDIGK